MRSLRILMAVDHFETGSWLSIYLEDLGHAITLVSTYAAGRSALGLAPYDVLISDVQLPDGDGWQLLRDIQTIQPIYGIALSGSNWNGECAKSRAAGFQQHFIKPLILRDFDSILRGI